MLASNECCAVGTVSKSQAVCERPPLSMTFGCELEWSDVDRRIDIPAELGSWEGPKMAGYYMGSEIDIANTQGKWRGIATDPLCITCPVGGEIHTVPSISIESQMFRIMRLMELFPKLGVACPNHGHIHVGIPSLKEDLSTLKNFFAYLEKNEEDLIQACCGYTAEDHDRIMNSKDLPDWAKSYLLVGDGKHISSDLYKCIKSAGTIEEAMTYLEEIPCVDWYPWSGESVATPNSHRTAVNMFNLTKGNTIEFRIFRASLNPVEIFSSLKFVQEFCQQAVLGESGIPVKEILIANLYQFPKLNFDPEIASIWAATRHTKGRCGPFKKSFSSATHITIDTIEMQGPCSGFDEGLIKILEICYCFWRGEGIEYLQRQWEKRQCEERDEPKGLSSSL